MSELNLAIYNGLGIYFSQKGKELRPGYIALTQRVDADNYLNSDGGIGEKIKFKETEEFFYKVFSNREEYQAVIQKLYEEGVGDPFERRPEIKAYASKLLEKYEATTYELRIAIVFVRAIIPSYREFKILGKYYNGFKIQEGGLAIHYDDDFEAPLRKRYGSLLPKHFIDAPEDERVAVCLEYSFLLVSLLRAVGIKAYITLT